MKTTSKIYEQNERIFDLLYSVTMQKIKKADPRTGGSLHLAHNWGNDGAQNVLNEHFSRMTMLNRIYERAYRKAFRREYPDHLTSKNMEV